MKLLFFALAIILATFGSLNAQTCPDAIDFNDPISGNLVRQLARGGTQEHNTYYPRNVFSKDNSYMVGVRESAPWVVVLYDGDGCYLRDMYTTNSYNWQGGFSRTQDNIWYTNKGNGRLFEIDVSTDPVTITELINPGVGAALQGPTQNQDGTRLGNTYTGKLWKSWRLSDMGDPISFNWETLVLAAVPGCNSDGNDIRYTGFSDYVSVNCHLSPGGANVIIDESTASVVGVHGPVGGTGANIYGHYDFSPAGYFVYSRKPQNGNESLKVFRADILGGNETVIYEKFPANRVSNMHVSCPDNVTTWCVLSMFPHPSNLPPSYAEPLDEIVKINLDGSGSEILARSGTVPGGDFWAQTQATPSFDGTRVSFNSNCDPAMPGPVGCTNTSSKDQYVLFLDPPPPPPACADGNDNDGDSLVDLADPGCANSQDDDEFNAPVTQCSDGLDNDNDGKIDLADPGCSGPADTVEGR